MPSKPGRNAETIQIIVSHVSRASFRHALSTVVLGWVTRPGRAAARSPNNAPDPKLTTTSTSTSSSCTTTAAAVPPSSPVSSRIQQQTNVLARSLARAWPPCARNRPCQPPRASCRYPPSPVPKHAPSARGRRPCLPPITWHLCLPPTHAALPSQPLHGHHLAAVSCDSLQPLPRPSPHLLVAAAASHHWPALLVAALRCSPRLRWGPQSLLHLISCSCPTQPKLLLCGP